jgi:hypothetical protein
VRPGRRAPAEGLSSQESQTSATEDAPHRARVRGGCPGRENRSPRARRWSARSRTRQSFQRCAWGEQTSGSRCVPAAGAVPGAQGGFHGGRRVVLRALKNAKSEGGHLHAVVKSENFSHVSRLRRCSSQWEAVTLPATPRCSLSLPAVWGGAYFWWMKMTPRYPSGPQASIRSSSAVATGSSYASTQVSPHEAEIHGSVRRMTPSSAA